MKFSLPFSLYFSFSSVVSPNFIQILSDYSVFLLCHLFFISGFPRAGIIDPQRWHLFRSPLSSSPPPLSSVFCFFSDDLSFDIGLAISRSLGSLLLAKRA